MIVKSVHKKIARLVMLTVCLVLFSSFGFGLDCYDYSYYYQGAKAVAKICGEFSYSVDSVKITWKCNEGDKLYIDCFGGECNTDGCRCTEVNSPYIQTIRETGKVSAVCWDKDSYGEYWAWCYQAMYYDVNYIPASSSEIPEQVDESDPVEEMLIDEALNNKEVSVKSFVGWLKAVLDKIMSFFVKGTASLDSKNPVKYGSRNGGGGK